MIQAYSILASVFLLALALILHMSGADMLFSIPSVVLAGSILNTR